MTGSQQVQPCSYNQLTSVVSSDMESGSNIYFEMGKLHGLAALVLPAMIILLWHRGQL